MAWRSKNPKVSYKCPDCTNGVLPISGAAFPSRMVDSTEPHVTGMEIKDCPSCKGTGKLSGPPA